MVEKEYFGARAPFSDAIKIGNILFVSGQIPKDIGIISFDDTRWFRFLNCPITAIRQPTERMGETAADILIPSIVSIFVRLLVSE